MDGQRRSEIGRTQAIEFNAVERFWQKAADIYVQSDFKKYNGYICCFEIDYMLIKEGRIFAIEITGTHYREHRGGKELLREHILNHYGVIKIVIDSDDKYVHQMNRLQQMDSAGQLLN